MRNDFIQPVDDVYSTDGYLDKSAPIDHQHPLSATMNAKVNAMGRRNLIDNGQHSVNQRATVAVAMAPGGILVSDRWNATNNATGTSNLSRATFATFGVDLPKDRPRPPFIQYIQMTAADAALAAGDYIAYQQNIEGFNVQHLMFGTNFAKPLVLTFDVYCTVSATMIVELVNNDSTNRSISRQYTAVGGKWTTITLTFPGDTLAGWVFDNDSNASLSLIFYSAGGTTYTSGTLASNWGAVVNANRLVGITNTFPATNGNIWASTNIQLEIGLAPTPYETRNYQDELNTCLRYFQKFSTAAASRFGIGQCYAVNLAEYELPLTVRMRAAPVLAATTSAPATFAAGTAPFAIVAGTALGLNAATDFGVSVGITVAAAPLVAGNASILTGNPAANLDLTADI